MKERIRWAVEDYLDEMRHFLPVLWLALGWFLGGLILNFLFPGKNL